jgi:hypothetical protein
MKKRNRWNLMIRIQRVNVKGMRNLKKRKVWKRMHARNSLVHLVRRNNPQFITHPSFGWNDKYNDEESR